MSVLFNLIHNDNCRLRSKGSRFTLGPTLGVWGLRVCSLDVAFTLAIVRNRLQPSISLSGLREVVTTCRFRGRRGIL